MTDKPFKIGDKVICSSLGNNNYITEIIDITPKGFIKTKEGTLFNSNGHQRGGSTWHSAFIYPVTQEKLNKIHHRNLVTYMRHKVEWDKLSLDQLRRVLAIVKEEVPK